MTARKTEPHLKRGPKPKPALPKRSSVGRPKKPLSSWPYRYWLAYYETIVKMGLSRRKAAMLVEVMYMGPVTIMPVERSGRFTVRLTVKPTTAIDPDDFAKECDSLRALAKWHRARPADLAWLQTMSEALKIAAGPWHPEASDMVLRLAASANETAWARQVLLPVLLERESAVPELADNFSPT